MLYRDVTSILTMVGTASETTRRGTGCVVMRSNRVCPFVMAVAFGWPSVRAASGKKRPRGTLRRTVYYI